MTGLLVCVFVALFALAEAAYQRGWFVRVARLAHGSGWGKSASEPSAERAESIAVPHDGTGGLVRPETPASALPSYLSCGHPEMFSQRLREGTTAYCFECAKWSERV